MNFLLLTLVWAAGGAGEWREDFHHDFRSQPLAPRLELYGPDVDRVAQSEPGGLHITLPRDRNNFFPVGVRTKFGIKGDFDVTATYEIVEAEEPDSGFGVGVTLFLHKADPSQDTVTVARLLRAKGKQVAFWDRAITGADGKPKFQGGQVPCTDRIVRLCLRRTGTTLHYLWAPGTTGDTFKEFHSWEFGADDVKVIKLSATTGRQAYALDVRFLDLRVRSGGQVAGVPAATPATTPEETGGKGWLALVIVFALAILLALALWRSVRQSRRAANMPAGAAVVAKQPEQEGAAPFVSFACSRCGKNLKTRAALAGKEVKCPQCGEAVLVPPANADESDPVSL